MTAFSWPLARLGQLVLLVACFSFQIVTASPPAATDSFTAVCPFVVDPSVYSSPPDGLRWSDPNTWPDGIIPGIGDAIGANATIPCNMTVLLDLPNLELGLLQVQGLLNVWDDPSLPSIYIKVHFVLVEGQFFIGTPDEQYGGKITIELTPNPNNRTQLQVFGPPPADPLNPRTVGHKAFVIIGGQVHLHGLPGPPSMPVWARLDQTALVGATNITIDANVVDSWPIGGQIAITSSDYDRMQTETFTITGVSSGSSATESVISLDKPLVYMHWGDATLSDGMGGTVDERSEVMLLSRNIVITGTDEPGPYQLEGGHFITYQTNWPRQNIEGVQFYKMGQQGHLGRYSLHFHVVGSVPGTVCRKNAIVGSKQRCIVVHASHNITVDSNVAFNTSGHCFMIEEGSEQDNTFINNIGVLTKPVTNLIAIDETDNLPATIWVTNGLNTYIGNVGAGSSHFGMWFEFRVAVRGMSLNIPALQRIQPRFTIMRNIYNNVVHSNDATGVTTYPPGMEPFKSGQRNRNTIYGMVVFKNVRLGALVHDSFDVNMTGATFADNAVAIKISQDAGNILADSRVISLTDNYGNPSGCSGTLTNVNCRPAVTSSPYSCTMPLKAGIPGRSVHGISRLSPQFGVVLDQNKRSNGPVPHQLINVRFSNFDDTCWNAAAIMVAPWNPNFWDAADSVQGLEFTDNTKPIYFPSSSRDPVYVFLGLTTGGELNRYLTLYDQDGSIIGSPGYVVANNPPLSPNKAGCTLQSDWNAYACPGTCYRSVQISYPEPGFVSSTSNSRTQYSFLRVTRVSDGAVLELDGNLNQTFPYEKTYRYFFFTLLAGQTYRVEAIPPPGSTFSPTIIKMQYLDVNVCNGAVTLQFKQAANQPWVTSSTNTVFYEQCPSGTPLPPDSPYATYAPVCVSYSPWVEVVMFPNFIDSVPLSQGIGTDGGICQSTNQCSLLWSGANGWLYDDSGLDRHPSFFNPTLLYPSYWKTGLAPLGWYPPTKFVATTIHMPDRYHVTYYYRQSFNVLNTAALTALQIDGVLEDGAAIYLNGNQIVQFNLPNATLTNRTLGLSNLPLAYWRTFTLPLTGVSSLFLVEGTNVVAVEQHVYTMAPSPLSFDLRLSAISL